jgi:hypothetical protein
MQIKTIQKSIRKKMDEWLLSIKDEGLRTDLQKNILVSGGSITSMLLNTKVNDYDVYINDRAVLKRLINYYIAGWKNDITVFDGAERDELIKKLSEQYDGADISTIESARAVSIRNLKPDQIKLFFETKDGGLKVNEGRNPDEMVYEPKFFSPNAISLSNDIQIVIRFHGDDVAIHKTFDFIHATNFFTFENGLVTNKEALESIITMQLRYQGSMYPLTSIIRMKKFLKRNWNINAGEILKIMFQISELDLHNPDVLEEQLIGVDVAYFAKLIEILRGIEDKTKITSQYLNTLIDKVFNEAHEEEE